MRDSPLKLKTERTAPSAQALEALISLVEPDLKKVSSLIVEGMQSPVPLVPELAGHIIESGGKRLRPVLTLVAARLCQGDMTRARKLAACVEFIHTATLLHDDVVDESDLRRGKPSANAVFGNQASVLVGDFLFSRAFQLMVEDGSLEVLRILSAVSAVMAEGEVLQLSMAHNVETLEETCLKVIASKTAELFAAACQIGAVIAARPTAEAEALRSYGLNLGMAFQLVDDVLDYSAQQAFLGKTIGDDFREGKVTLPVVLAFQQGTDLEKAFWRRTIRDHQQEPKDLEKATEILNRHQVLAQAIEKARHYTKLAMASLDIFPSTAESQALRGVLDFIVDREF